MSSGIPTHPARRTVTITDAELDDTDGLVSGVAGKTQPIELGPADYNGDAVVVDGDGKGTAWAGPLPRAITISRADKVGAYKTDPIIVTGMRGGRVVTEELVPEDADGDDIIRGEQIFDYPPTILIPAQASDEGSFDVGVGDVGTPGAEATFVGGKLHEAGSLSVGYMGGHEDTIPVEAKVREHIAPVRVLATTAKTITVYLP